MQWNSSQAPDSFTKERFRFTSCQQLASKMPMASYKIAIIFLSKHLCLTRYVWVPKYTSNPSKGAVNASFTLAELSNLTKWQGVQQKRFQQCPECLIVLQHWDAVKLQLKSSARHPSIHSWIHQRKDKSP